MLRQRLIVAYEQSNIKPNNLSFTFLLANRLSLAKNQVRWIALGLITIISWIFFGLDRRLVPASSDSLYSFEIISILIFSIITFISFAQEAIQFTIWGQKVGNWIAISLIGGLLGTLGFNTSLEDWINWSATLVTISLLYMSIYIVQRLWIGDKVFQSVIREVCSDLSTIKGGRSSFLDRMPQIIRQKLRYERVYIFEITSNDNEIEIIGEQSDLSVSIGQRFPIKSTSLPGKAIIEDETIAINNLRTCDYFYPITKDDDSRAEIAIPISVRGSTYGVLDVRAKQSDIFKFDDIEALETIAELAGAVLWHPRANRLLANAETMWQKLADISEEPEEAIFMEFAKFANKALGAEPVIYYPLSPAGFPVSKPYIYGHLEKPTRMRAEFEDMQSPLLQLVRQWQPYPINDTFNDPIFSKQMVAEPPSFVEREGIKSSYFSPVGIHQEPIGALWLNYRNPKQFDNLFEVIVKSFAQALALPFWRRRYLNTINVSFGRPELNIHNLIARHGLKEGVVNQLRDRKLNELDLLSFLRRIDAFISEVTLAKSTMPPQLQKSHPKTGT